MPHRIKLILWVEGLKPLAEEMAVGGYFSENHEASAEDLQEMEQRVLDDGGIELTMKLTLKSIGGHRHRNIIVPEGNGRTPLKLCFNCRQASLHFERLVLFRDRFLVAAA